jgi:MCP methyltransferase, CheR-type
MSVSAQTFSFVSDLVRARSAIQLTPGKEYLVESRLLPLARSAGLSGGGAVDQYVQRARRDPAAQTSVVEALTTNETSWFRDNVPFQSLRQVVQPARRAENRGELRIWSAACSTGQEPYSIAMTLLDMGDPSFSVLATDLSQTVLDRAREARYTQLEVNRGLPAPMLVRHFSRVGTGWQIAPTVHDKVTFRQHNLLDNPPSGSGFDVVFLRNVLIYFDMATKRQILGRVARALRPGGFLLLGAAETIPASDPAWTRVGVSRGAIYQLGGGPA